MAGWLDRLTPQEQQQWDEFVVHARNETFEKMASSAMVMSLVPEDGKPDPKFCLELGAAIMMEKPIIAIALKGTTVPEKLRLIAQEVVTLDCDIDTEEGAREAGKEITKVIKRLMDEHA